MYHQGYWRNRQPVLAKSPTGIGQIANRYWPNHQLLLAKSPTGIDEIVYQGNELAIWPIPVGDFVNTVRRFGQYRLAIWPLPVDDLANSSWRFGQYRLVI